MDFTFPLGLPRAAARAAMAAILLTLVVSCGQTPEPGGGSQSGRISGNLSYGPSGAAAHATAPAAGRIAVGRAESPSFRVSSAGGAAPFVPGEVIVRFAASAVTAQGVVPSLEVQGVRMERARSLAIPETALFRINGADRRGTLAVVEALNARADVIYAHPNYILERAETPGDAEYSRMWHYPVINAEGAWDITTGSPDVVVAVLDTGMLMQHPDRPSTLLPGYDFVSSISNLDGDGRDSNPADPGPWTESGYHGSHVTGTVAAAANNDYRGGSGADGIVGVGWQTAVLPVRVLGPSGTITDIADGIVWSAGGSVSGAPANANPARIINLSLGGPLACSETPALQDAINQATASDAIVVAAAGNQADEASGYSPASCTGVIAVGASTLDDVRAPYSNFGPELALLAPGGTLAQDLDSNGQPDGVLSLTRDDQTGAYGFRWMEGTSMATPHVSGVISLMLAANPSLTRSEVRSILTGTARPYSSSQCDAGLSDRSLSGSDCGAGLVDAQAAVEAADGSTPPPPADGALSFSPDPVVLGTESSAHAVTFSNTGAGELTWTLLYATGDPENPDMLNDRVLFASKLTGTIASGDSEDVTVQIDRTEVSTAGAYTAYYAFDTDGDDATVEAELPVTFIIGSDEPANVSGPMLVEALLEGSLARSGGTSSSGILYTYDFSVAPGSNLVYAWSDENGDGAIDAGDWFGSYGAYVPVSSGQHVGGIDIALERVQSVEQVETSLPEGASIAQIEASGATSPARPSEPGNDVPH